MDLNIGQLPNNKQDPEQLFIESRVEEQTFQNYMPKSGFIAEYFKYTSISEAPGSFHFWVATTILSASLQRRIWLAKGIYRIYPNLYVVLVAPSGRCRKTGAIRTGTEIVQKLDFINLIADKTTPEALLEALMRGPVGIDKEEMEDLLTPGMKPMSPINISVDSTGFIRSTEMSTFLNKSTYTTGMVTILTDLFDCPDHFEYRTRNSKPIILDNVAVSMIAGTTPEWLATNLPEAAFEGGFMSRVIWVVKQWRDRVIPFEDEPDKKEMEKLVKMLRYIYNNHSGPVELTDAAKAWYIKWYSSVAMQPSDNEKLSGFNERLPDTVVKLAMLLQASERPGKLLIDVEYLEQAEKILRWSLEKMFRAFEVTELSRVGQLRRILNNVLDHHGEITQRDIMRKVGGRLDYRAQFEEVRQIMEEAGELRVETIQTGKVGRPRIIWRRPLQDEL